MTTTCESCGRAGEALTTVRRVWVTPEQWDVEGRVDLGDLEAWCDTCQAHYAHQPTDETSDTA